MDEAGNLQSALHVIQMKRTHIFSYILILTKDVIGFLTYIYNVDFLKKISLSINIQGHNPCAYSTVRAFLCKSIYMEPGFLYLYRTEQNSTMIFVFLCEHMQV